MTQPPKDPNHDLNYYDTFILVADDCPILRGRVPPLAPRPSVASLQYTLLSEQPYTFTQAELLFEVHLRRNNIVRSEKNHDWLWADFFSQSHPCLRASPLTKSYGWGVHFGAQGRAALCGAETEAYRHFAASPDGTLTRLKALRNRRADKRAA